MILDIFPYIKSSGDYSDKTVNRNIYLSRAEISATGYLNENKSVTVFSGSIVRYASKPSLPSLQDLREELIDTNLII